MKDKCFVALLVMVVALLGAVVFLSVALSETEERMEKCEFDSVLVDALIYSIQEQKGILKLEKEMAKDCYPNCPGWVP